MRLLRHCGGEVVHEDDAVAVLARLDHERLKEELRGEEVVVFLLVGVSKSC